jgi:hypothetical protein
MPVEKDIWRTLLADKEAFLSVVVNNLVGWLDDYAAKRTLDILGLQETMGIAGSLYEVGIYHGKYLSLLLRSAALTGGNVLGIDLFEYLSEQQFSDYFEQNVSPANLAKVAQFKWNILSSPSGDLGDRTLLEYLGSEARFISLDGSHEYDDVLWDLRVADQVLSPAGVIAADDIINPICLGVAAAVYRFLEDTPSLVPFAQVSNKLFLCRPAWADRYRAAVEAGILADMTGDPKTEEYRANHTAGHRRNIEATFRGYRVLTVRL